MFLEQWTLQLHIIIRSPLVGGDDLAVNHRFVGQRSQRPRDSGVSRIEVVVVARPKLNLSVAFERHGAVAIELQFPQPLRPIRKSGSGQQKHRLDECCDTLQFRAFSGDGP